MTFFAPKKSLGQHWLLDADALDAMVEAAEITAADTVLEIGPGPGALTTLLVERARQVIAVELDDALAAALPQAIKAKNLRVDHQDILRYDLTQLPFGYKVAANIPYYLTSHLIRLLAESTNPPLLAALLVQKEVAQRLAAKPGSMSLLSVSAQYYFEVSLARMVKAELFSPPPKVDSQIVVLHRHAKPLFSHDTKQYFRVVKAGFSQKRKTLENSLSGGLQITKAQAAEALEKAGIAAGSRAQTLSLEQWQKLADCLA